MTDDELTQLLCRIVGQLPGWEWRPDGPAYPPSEVAIFYGAIADSPDRAVGIRLYMASEAEGVFERRAQVRFRGPKNAPNGADKLAAPVFAVLHGLSRVGGISDIRRISMAPMGADKNGREERVDNYLVTLDNPEAS